MLISATNKTTDQENTLLLASAFASELVPARVACGLSSGSKITFYIGVPKKYLIAQIKMLC